MFAKLWPNVRIVHLTGFSCKCFALGKKQHHFLLPGIRNLYVTWRWPAVENIWKPLFYFPAVKCNLIIRFLEFRVTAAPSGCQIT